MNMYRSGALIYNLRLAQVLWQIVGHRERLGAYSASSLAGSSKACEQGRRAKYRITAYPLSGFSTFCSYLKTLFEWSWGKAGAKRVLSYPSPHARATPRAL